MIAKKRKLTPDDVMLTARETRGAVFGGPPGIVAMAALDRKFEVVCSRLILEEVERTLLIKLKFGRGNTKRLINRMLQVVDLYEPEGKLAGRTV